jgi:hypothetical protein
MDTDVRMHVLNASSVSIGGNDHVDKNSDRQSFVYKIFTKFEFDRDDAMTPKSIRYRFMALANAIVTSTKGDSDSTYLTTMEGKRIDPQSSPTNPDVFQDYVKWTRGDGRRPSAGTTIMLHSSVRYAQLKSIIRPFLKENTMWFTANFTASSIEEIVRVAVIPFMNPEVTFRKGFSEELGRSLQAVVNLKDDEFKSRHPCITDSFKFDVVVSIFNERMKFKKTSVSTPILLVESPKSHSILCRAILQDALDLMSPTDEGPSRYTCVPLALKNSRKYPKGPATVFHLLQQHARFLSEFQSFQIKGVHRTTMDILQSVILTDCPDINAMASTFQTDEHGRWTVCTTQGKIKAAKIWIDTNLQHAIDAIPNESKPPVPASCPPQRIIDYAAVPDSQFESLYALSGLSPAATPTVNAWQTTPLTPKTSTAKNPPTISTSQTTLISSLATQLNTLQSRFESRAMATADDASCTPIQLSEPVSKFISDQLLSQTANLQSALDENMDYLKRNATTQDSKILEMQNRLNSHENSISSLNYRIENFENNMNLKTAPLQEAVEAGGLAALIQKTVLGCLTQTHHQTLPMDEDSAHTPSRPPHHTVPVTLSGNKRVEPPSPFRPGEPTSPLTRTSDPFPLRVRRDDASSQHSRTNKRD